MKICEIEFASSSIAFSMQIINELELNLFSLEFNYLRTTSLELNSVKRVRVKLNFSQTRDVSKFNFSRSRADVASNIRLVKKEIEDFPLKSGEGNGSAAKSVSGIFLLPSQCYKRFSSIRGTTLATWPKCGAPDYQLSLYKANVSLLRHSSSCILCGNSNSFIQIHIANSCPCFSCAWLLRTMRYNATEAQLHCAPDRTLGYAIFFSLPFSPKQLPCEMRRGR